MAHTGPTDPNFDPPEIEKAPAADLQSYGTPLTYYSYPESEPDHDQWERDEDAQNIAISRSPLRISVGQSVKSESGQWYRCIQPIGGGKSASAFLMVQTSGSNAGIFYALKVLQQYYEKKRWNEFAQELSILKQLDHPAIMRIADAGYFRHGNGVHPFYFCPYFPETLEQVIRRGCTVAQKLSFAIQLCSAIAYLAFQKPPIVHCDIKPSNIFVSGLTCVLGDFGLMRLAASPSSSEGPSGPSLHHYRTPDIASAARGEEQLSSKSDVFQLGLVLAELFCGINPCQPAQDGSDDVVLSSIPWIHGEVGTQIFKVIRSMLAMAPGKRPHARELIEMWKSILFDIVYHTYQIEPRIF